MDVRLILDSASEGAWNMALDEALLQSAAESGLSTLRFYAWSEPTLSLGYFQKYPARQRHSASLGNRCVRRTTGGGAILHHYDLTYSFTTPLASRETALAASFYNAFHQTLVEELNDCGIEALLCPQTLPCEEESFLCFQRRAMGDVLLDDAKIAGSAQRRHCGGLLQHGSLLLKSSPSAPELRGIFDLTEKIFQTDWLVENWTSRIAHFLKMDFQKGDVFEADKKLARLIQSEKYANPSWTQKR